jgi:prephenate dehydrogenase
VFPLEQVSIVGVGLLGGSLGLALRARGLAERVVGIGRDREALEEALEAGVLTDGTTSVAEGVAAADIVVVCTPVGTIAGQVQEIAANLQNRTTIVTDVGSTKHQIVAELEGTLDPGIRYLGSHPFAGWHRAGFRSASPELFVGHPVVLTPTSRTPPGLVADLTEFWSVLGGNVLCMSPQEHDLAAAMVSHLPHVLASALAAATPVDWLKLVAGSWRDATRVAASSEALWTDIMMTNRGPILQAIEHMDGKISAWKKALRDGDAAAIKKLWQEGKEHRNVVGD